MYSQAYGFFPFCNELPADPGDAPMGPERLAEACGGKWAAPCDILREPRRGSA